MSLSVREQRYFDQIPKIDPGLIGPVVGQGAQMLVRRYGEHSVVKAPLQHVGEKMHTRAVAKVVGLTSVQAAEDQYGLYQQYLAPYLVATKILADTKRRVFC